jgi:poly(rC)-binding protein 2/3/4
MGGPGGPGGPGGGPGGPYGGGAVMPGAQTQQIFIPNSLVGSSESMRRQAESR